ncbi:hypothetical protein ACFQX6_33910 [Streptosporangium lutulentum]
MRRSIPLALTAAILALSGTTISPPRPRPGRAIAVRARTCAARTSPEAPGSPPTYAAPT